MIEKDIKGCLNISTHDKDIWLLKDICDFERLLLCLSFIVSVIFEVGC